MIHMFVSYNSRACRIWDFF